MISRSSFSIHESAILLDAYLSARSTNITRLQLAKQVSEQLRKMAVNSGLEIDDSYRSVPGITNRIMSMECAYNGTSKNSSHASDVFMKIVDLYKNDHAQFDEILSEAKNMITAETNEFDSFSDWVSQNIPDIKTKWLKDNMQRVEAFGNKRNIFSGSIYDVTDLQILSMILEQIRKDRFFQFSCKKIYKDVVADFIAYYRYRSELKKPENSAASATGRKNTTNNTDDSDKNKAIECHSTEFTLENIPDLTFSKPLSYVFCDHDKVTVKNWSNLYIKVLSELSPEQLNTLKNRFNGQDFSSNKSSLRRPYEIQPNIFIELNHSAGNLVSRLRDCLTFCAIPITSLTIEYKGKNAVETGETIISNNLYKVIKESYPNGLRFDDTVIRLLSSQTGSEINSNIVSSLQKEMFKRSDGLHFLKDMIISKEECTTLKEKITQYLTSSSICEVSVIYNNATLNGIRSEEDFADFVQFLLPETVRISAPYGFRIIRSLGISVNNAIEKLTQRIVTTVKEKGCVTEEDLQNDFPGLSGAFLKKLIEKNTDEVITTTINDILCYQTIEAMGFDDGFSELLNNVVNRIDELDLLPSQEALHILLSVESGQNFREAYGIPDDKTFRRIIAMYYNGEKSRVWKSGNFVEG